MRQSILRLLRLLYRKSRDVMVAILLFFVKQYNKLRWRVCYKEIDVSAIDTVAYITDIIPIHITSWHHGSRFFRVVSNGKALFVKVATNRDIGKREIEFYNKVAKSNSSLANNIPQEVKWIEKNNAIYIVMDYIDGDSLSMEKVNSFDNKERVKICNELWAILLELQRIGIAHNDIRMANIMYDGKRVYLIDFGYATSINAKEDLLAKISVDEKSMLNEYNRIGAEVLCDAFSMFNVMKGVNPELYSTQYEIWLKINQMMKEDLQER